MRTIKNLFLKLDSRKFWLCIGIIVLISIFFLLGKLTEPYYADCLKWIAGLYMGANVIEAFKKTGKIFDGETNEKNTNT